MLFANLKCDTFKEKQSLPNFVLAALSIIDLMQYFEWNINEQINFFKKFNLPKKGLEGFRRWKNLLHQLAQPLLNKNLVPEDEIFLFQIFKP